MAAARRHLERLAGGVRVRDPRVPLVSNADGALVRTGEDLLGRLVHQVAAPVRWDACMETFGAMGVSAVVELPPGGTLTALIRKALPGVETVALRTPDDLDAARALIDAHRVQPEPAPAWRMLVAPIAGTFRAHRLREGERVPALTSVGDVVSQRTSIPVQASASGVLVEWLASDGDPVSPGQPLARLHPEPHA
jgi:[acyl-carrier-protein] S-malonyltransferase